MTFQNIDRIWHFKSPAVVIQFLKNSFRNRHYFRNMDCPELEPPTSVRGMKVLEREAFQKRVQIPRLRMREEQLSRVLPLVKKWLLKMEHLKPVRALEGKEREILFHPLPVKSWESLPVTELAKHNVNESNFYTDELQLSYENWRADEVFKSVLPLGEEGCTSYSRIGHIVHLNLRDHLLPYKQLIGEVLCEKVANCRTVVNKASTIDNTYRFFQIELVCGDEDYKVETKENGVIFEFDFAKVYWNPRLGTEHVRIIDLLRPGDVLCDVFAGVGPFSVPAAKKRCNVLANDLNPESFRWLQHNAKRNKCSGQIQFCNKDGRDFILEDLKQDLLKRWRNQNSKQNYNIHITMNLPALSVEFLDAFRGLFIDEAEELNFSAESFNYPLVHVYLFAKGENTKSIALELINDNLGVPLDANLEGQYFVRHVAPNKDMYRVSFYLTKEILTTAKTPAKLVNEDATATRKRVASCEHDPAVDIKVKCI